MSRGRPRNAEQSVQVRVPESMRDAVKQFAARMAVVDRGDPVCLTNSEMARILKGADISDFTIQRESEYTWVINANPKPRLDQQAKVIHHPYLEGQTVRFQ